MKRLFKLIKYGTNNSSDYDKLSEKITNYNYKNFKFLAIIELFIYSMMMLASLLYNHFSYSPYMLVYLIKIINCIVILLLLITILNQNKKDINLLMYLYVVLGLTIAGYLCVKNPIAPFFLMLGVSYLAYGFLMSTKPIYYVALVLIINIYISFIANFNQIEYGLVYLLQCWICAILGCAITYIAVNERMTREKIIANITLLKDTDHLTGLLNREAIEKRINSFLGHPDKLGALFFLDIDNFKHINDAYGHLVGDEALVSVSNYLMRNFRDTDYISRLGGDEFVVLLNNISDHDAAIMKAQLLLTKSAKETFVPGETLTFSIGIAYTDQASSYQELVDKADEAMYKAKKRGKSAYYVYKEKVK